MPQKHQTSEAPIDSPLNIPFSGWKSIALGMNDDIKENNVSIVSAGVAFYSFLAIFPAIMALISIYGLAMDPQQVERQLNNINDMMPEEAYGVIESRMENFIQTAGSTLSWATTAGILFSIWSANRGTKSLFTGVIVAYKTKNNRGFLKHNAVTLAFTFGGIILIIICIAVIVLFPALVGTIPLPEEITDLIGWLRWVVLALLVSFFLCLVYKFAPPQTDPKLKWVMPGALIATFLWLLASWGFSIYISNFGNYGEIYGSISAVVVLMMWLYLSSFIVLLGAELNAEIEFYANQRTIDD
jgi:membrane protein